MSHRHLGRISHAFQCEWKERAAVLNLNSIFFWYLAKRLHCILINLCLVHLGCFHGNRYFFFLDGNCQAQEGSSLHKTTPAPKELLVGNLMCINKTPKFLLSITVLLSSTLMKKCFLNGMEWCLSTPQGNRIMLLFFLLQGSAFLGPGKIRLQTFQN